jgi:hypothetical protein
MCLVAGAESGSMHSFITNIALALVPPIRRVVAQRDQLLQQVQASASEAEAQRAEAMAFSHALNFQPNYNSDGMAVLKNITFLSDPTFQLGYNRACGAGGGDWGIHWRFHTCLWAAKNALRLEGDFVECGVGKGFNSSGIMAALDWNGIDRQFYLFDTFTGVVEELCTDAERDQMQSEWGGVDAHNKGLSAHYADSFEAAKNNFAEWHNVNLVEGAIPETLTDVQIEKVAYLHIDMNCVIPEMEAIDFFWPKLSKGACVVLDDYAYFGYHLQLTAWNEWGQKNNTPILTLPTGQGLIIKD